MAHQIIYWEQCRWNRMLVAKHNLVTGSYWIYKTVENMLDLNSIIEQMQRNCLEWSEDSSALFFDQKSGFSGAYIHKDNLCDYLFQLQNYELDQLTLLTWEIIMGYFFLIVARQIEEVLQGKVHNHLKNCKGNSNGTTNKFCFRKSVWIIWQVYHGETQCHNIELGKYNTVWNKLFPCLTVWILLSKICFCINQQEVL